MQSRMTEDELIHFGRQWVHELSKGQVVLLEGPLGAGKTTLVRSMLRGIGYDGPVRSPTFNLIQTFDTRPPVMHADLYRLESADGLGIEEYFDTHLCFIEWPDRLGYTPEGATLVTLSIADNERQILIRSSGDSG